MTANTQAPVFQVDKPVEQGQEVSLSGDEGAHIVRSKRMKPGEDIILTDGEGMRARGVISAIDSGSKSLTVHVLGVERIQPSKPIVTLASAIPKGERQSVLLNMATQLGMDRYIPLDCDRSVVRFQPRMAGRWQRLIDSACKQSRRCHFPRICPVQTVDQLLDDDSTRRTVVVGDIEGRSLAGLFADQPRQNGEIILLAGPEGGFSEKENRIIAEKNSLKLRLGDNVLRTETAAVALMAATNQLKQRQQCIA